MEKYLFLDCETAETSDINGKVDSHNGQVYDIGLMVIDNTGHVYEKMSFINEDVFFGMPDSMSSAYYASKIPQYLTDMRMGKRKIINTKQLYFSVRAICKKWDIQGIIAHNAYFDVNALNATIRYQTKSDIRFFFPWNVKIIDTLAMSRKTFAHDPEYIAWCEKNSYMTNHKVPRPRLTAEILYRYITGTEDFTESHTGLEDVEIEKEIYLMCLNKMGE